MQVMRILVVRAECKGVCRQSNGFELRQCLRERLDGAHSCHDCLQTGPNGLSSLLTPSGQSLNWMKAVARTGSAQLQVIAYLRYV